MCTNRCIVLLQSIFFFIHVHLNRMLFVLNFIIFSSPPPSTSFLMSFAFSLFSFLLSDLFVCICRKRKYSVMSSKVEVVVRCVRDSHWEFVCKFFATKHFPFDLRNISATQTHTHTLAKVEFEPNAHFRKVNQFFLSSLSFLFHSSLVDVFLRWNRFLSSSSSSSSVLVCVFFVHHFFVCVCI